MTPGGGPIAAASRAPSGNALPVGARVGDFEVATIIGEGGFGIVYEAFDHTLHRRVALKEYMPSALASRRGDFTVAVRSPQHEQTFRAGLKSFVNEARLLAQFDHPALVKVFRFWEANETAYMVMPLYEGRTLKEALKEHAHPDEGWLKALLSPLLDALETLHQAKCYHRDIAPDNILILNNGAPLLLDFGAARRIIGDLTQAVTVILKPGYAPIEQYADDAALKQGPWTDIYALSAVICLAITGKAPSTSVTRMVSDPMVPLQTSVQGYSPGFLAALDRGLAVRPEQRPQSVAEFRDLLGLRTIAPVTSMSASRRDPLPPTMIAPSVPDAEPQDTEEMDALSRSMMASQPQSWIRSAAGELPPTQVTPPAATMPSPPDTRVGPPRTVDVPRSIEIPRSAEIPRSVELPRSLVVPPTGSSGPRPTNPTTAKVPPADGTRGRGTTIAPPPLTPSDYQEPKTVMTVLPSVLMGALLLLLMGGGVWWFSRAVPVAPVPPVADATPRPSAPPPRGSTSAPTSGAAPAASGSPASPSASATTAPAGPSAPAGAPSTPSTPSTAASVTSPDPKAAATAPAAAATPAAPPRPVRPLDCGFAPPASPPAADGAPSAEAPPPPPSGRVPLSIRPWGQIYVEGRNCGLSPPKKDLLLPEGKYKLEVRNPGFESHVENIEISARRIAPLVTHTFK